MKQSDQSLPIFKVGDRVVVKRNYTFDGYSNEHMVDNGNVTFDRYYTVKRANIFSSRGIPNAMTFIETGDLQWTSDRFELAKHQVVQEIIKDLL